MRVFDVNGSAAKPPPPPPPPHLSPLDICAKAKELTIKQNNN